MKLRSKKKELNKSWKKSEQVLKNKLKLITRSLKINKKKQKSSITNKKNS